MTIHRWLIERNLGSYQPIHHLLFTPAHCKSILQRCLTRSGWYQADWGRIVLSNKSRFQLCRDDNRKRVWRHPGQQAYYCTLHMRYVPLALFFSKIMSDHIRYTCCYELSYNLSYTSLASQIADLSPIEHILAIMGRRLHLPGNVDDLVRQF
ncbi:HTH_Tnp_Tc3_2 domain-containing protein [Trichonephila clavipes]|nr:HTH_Tnp_Tc3_2 domain-containing protein [Trichonephila clavipes]